jgi:hypothetical protein
MADPPALRTVIERLERFQLRVDQGVLEDVRAVLQSEAALAGVNVQRVLLRGWKFDQDVRDVLERETSLGEEWERKGRIWLYPESTQDPEGEGYWRFRALVRRILRERGSIESEGEQSAASRRREQLVLVIAALALARDAFVDGVLPAAPQEPQSVNVTVRIEQAMESDVCKVEDVSDPTESRTERSSDGPP